MGKKRTLLYAILVFVLIFGGLGLFIKNLNSPAVGTIVNAPLKNNPQSDTPSSPLNYSDKMISFNYPPNLETIASPKNSGALDVVTFYSKRNLHENEHLAISVIRESLANDSGVSYRRGHKDIYKEESDPSGALIFTSSVNGSEKTAFLAHGDLVATISLTIPGSKDLSDDFNTIFNSFQWK